MPGRTKKKVVPTTAQVLRKARKYVQRRWVKGTMGTDSGAVCAVGAIRKAVTGDPYEPDGRVVTKAQNALLRAIRAMPYCDGLGEKYRHVTSFNDDETTKKADVLRAFSRAIKDSK